MEWELFWTIIWQIVLAAMILAVPLGFLVLLISTGLSAGFRRNTKSTEPNSEKTR